MRLPWPRRQGQQVHALRKALDRANRRWETTAGMRTDVQLLAQVSGSRDWPQILEHWTRKAGLTGSWPKSLAADERVVNLWPIPVGSVQLTAGIGLAPQKRQPRKLLGTPALIRYSSTVSAVDDALARAIVAWLDDVLAHDEYPNGIRLAPPILEQWAPKGVLMERRIVTFNLDWALAAAENVAWPPTE
jgi:hypothetical protein